MRLLFLLLFLSLQSLAQNKLPAIGLWREHLPYQGTIDITASDKKIYAATEYSLFSIDLASKEIERISKIAGLSETGISSIKYDPSTKKLVVAYSNSNIDIIDQQGIHNIPDLERKIISGDKSIYHIFCEGNRYYLSTGVGVIVVDADKLEIKDSWLFDDGGNYVKATAFTKTNSFLYAATNEGLKKISAANNPADFTQWQTVSGSNGLGASACRSVALLQSKVIALQNDSLFVENGSSWQPFFSDQWPILSINVSENKLMVCQRRSNGEAQVVVLNADGTVHETIRQTNVISFPKNAIKINKEYWIADLYGGLSNWMANAPAEVYKLNSPDNIALGQTIVYRNTLYATAGAVNSSWNYQYNSNGVFKLKNGSWTSYNQYHFPQLDSLLDFITVAVDPRDESVWAGSYGGGLVHITNSDQIEILKQNSPLEPTVGDPASYRVAGLAFDHDNNLWISNFGANHQLHVLKSNGEWRSFSVPFFLNTNALAQIIVDDAAQKWIVSPLGNGLVVFNDNNTLDDAGDDRWKLYRAGTTQGNLPSNEVLCIAKDKTGFIWVGTGDGIAVIQCPEIAVAGGCEAILPVIKEDAFANYLFKGQAVKSIAVDGANRKWIATAEGAWFVSPEGDKILSHFTEDNSPLLSNTVQSIAIDGHTGEVYFATDKGVCSFRSSATEAEETKNNVLVFPNPVPLGYTGTIAIRGLPENSLVKITELNGRLVHQTRSLGGQATWNGKDYKGRQPSTGIYLVLAVDELNREKVVTKIVFAGG